MQYKFFITSNLGGGGNTVPRLFKHIHYLNSLPYNNIGLLLNFRYLTFYKNDNFRFKFDPVFNKNILEKLDKTCVNFIEEILNNFNNTYRLDKHLEVLLDSGSGAIANYLLLEKNYSKQNVINYFNNLISYHTKYVEDKNIFSNIAMDYSLKNTYKKSASTESIRNYNDVMNDLSNNKNEQFKLLNQSLKLNKKSKQYAPIHGCNPSEYLTNYLNIRDIELISNKKFYGFAIGGLGGYPKKNKGYSIIANIIKSIRNQGENRPIHILGSSAITHIPTLIYGGANSFDCHSAWRRAMDGGQSGSPYKILKPMINKKFEFNLNFTRPLEYSNIENFNNSNWFCDCKICKDFKIDEIKEMILNRNADKENYYLALILIYLHAVYQHSFLLAKIDREGINNFFTNIPNSYKIRKKTNSKSVGLKNYLYSEIDLLN